MTFAREFIAGWADLDANAHMRNTAFLDRCVDLRMMYFEAHGFSPREFARLRIGPVVQRDEVDYFREVGLLERFLIDLSLDGLSADGSRFRLVNAIARADGTPIARVTSAGGWLDLDARRLAAPPRSILEALEALPRTAEFVQLKSSLRPRGENSA